MKTGFKVTCPAPGPEELTEKPTFEYLRSKLEYSDAIATFQNGWLSMKVAACIFALGVSLTLVPVLPGQSLKPFKIVDLNKAKISGSTCQIELPEGLSSVMWLDERHLMASSFAARCPSALPSPTVGAEAAVFDITGSVQATDRRSNAVFFSKGPRGTIAALGSGEIELMDAQLHREQTITCPNGSKSCRISLAPSPALDSEFAVCSTVDRQQQVCDFYSG
ncbi:MAG: hypothetical protein WBX22_31640 [Silvibacterium sp.]